MIVSERRYESLRQAMAVHPTWMEIDLDALAHNLREVRRRIGPQKRIIASVKANAYGHGVAEIGRALEGLGVHALATGSFMDAKAMRNAGIEAPIVMFAGNLAQGAADLLRYDLTPTLYDPETAKAVSEAARDETPIYVKVDSGLGRLGVPVDQAVGFIREIAALPRLSVEGIYTHLPFVDRGGAAWAKRRIVVFCDMLDALRQAGLEVAITQSLASSGIAAGLDDRCTAVCPGHLLYGGLARLNEDAGDLTPYRPVLAAIKSRLIQVARHGGERTFGAGGARPLEAGTVTGVAPVGLFDGYRNARAGRTASMLLQGRRVEVLGVNLEYATVDLTGIEGVQAGDEVVVLGESGDERITIEAIAGWQEAGTLDVLMSLDQRLARVYRGGPGATDRADRG